MMRLDSEPYRALKPLPDGWDLVVGVDTGTYMSAVFTAIPPGDVAQLIPIFEAPNYRYVTTEIELLGETVPEWARRVYSAFKYFCPGKERCKAWADPNTQFRAELAHYGLDLRPNYRGPELRVEIAREYLNAKEPQRVFLSPWLTVLPYEIENAKWPEETTASGKFMRLKRNDHSLDCFEHTASRRPRGRQIRKDKPPSFLQQHLAAHRWPGLNLADPHVGRI